MLEGADGVFEFEACIGGILEFNGHNVVRKKERKRESRSKRVTLLEDTG